MSAKSFARLAAVIFGIIALLQLSAGWPATVGGVDMPLWPSWVACVVTAVLAWLGFRASAS